MSRKKGNGAEYTLRTITFFSEITLQVWLGEFPNHTFFQRIAQ